MTPPEEPSAATIKELAERIARLEEQLVRAQRMECVGLLASGVAHDLNNVLTPIITSCQLLALPLPEQDRGPMLDVLLRSARRGAGLVKQLLAFSRQAASHRMDVSLPPLLHEIRQIVAQTFSKSIRIDGWSDRGLWPVKADPTQLHQVLLNLCINARDAMPAGGTLRVTAENGWFGDFPPELPATGRSPRPWVIITVTDSGVGIAADVRERIFDPFFTTKEAGQGTGLGLSTSLAIVKGHGGTIRVYSEVGKGSAFTIYLPAIAGPDSEKEAPEEAPLPRGNGELVLVVDDEEAIREITQRTLQSYGYTVETAANGVEAVAVQRRNLATLRAVLMDMTMPVMDGPTTIHALHRIAPELPIIAASGLQPEGHLARCPPRAVKAFLAKPYSAETLLNTLQDILHHHDQA